MSEIAHVLPASVLADPPAPKAKRSPDDYAREIGTSRRTIFRWMEIGREAKDWCPLDAPERMLDWWDRRMGKRAPAELVAWVEKHRRVAPSPSAATSSPPQSPRSAAAPGAGTEHARRDQVPVNLSQLVGHGLEHAVATMRRTVQALGDELSKAWLGSDEFARDTAQNKFNEATEELRKAEKALIEIQKARGDLAPKTEFTSDLITLATALRGMHARMPDNVVSALRKSSVAFTEEQLSAVRAAVASERAAEQHLFRNARHWRATPEGAVIPAATPAAA